MLTPIVNKYINKVLGKLTKMLSDETTTALTENLGESKGQPTPRAICLPGDQCSQVESTAPVE